MSVFGMRPLRAAVTTAAALLLGCDPGNVPIPLVVTRDSTGVITYRAHPAAPIAAWTVAPAPTLVIGGRQHPEGAPLYEVRAGRLLKDGSFVIANSGADEVRSYTADGALLRVLGREGGGPGEFQYIAFLEIIGDSLWVYDLSLRRFTVFGLDGAYGRVLPLGAISAASVMGIGVLADGAALAGAPDGPFNPGPGPWKQFWRVLVHDPATGIARDMGRFFAEESFWHVEGEGLIGSEVPFERKGSFATHADHWYHTGGDEYRIEEYNATGELTAIYSHSDVPRPVRDADLEAFLDRAFRDSERPTRSEIRLRRVPLPERLPAYVDLRLDHVGNVWARPYTLDESEGCWHVFQLEPTRFIHVCMPIGFDILDIGESVVLGVHRDQRDVESVAVYRLIK